MDLLSVTKGYSFTQLALIVCALTHSPRVRRCQVAGTLTRTVSFVRRSRAPARTHPSVPNRACFTRRNPNGDCYVYRSRNTASYRFSDLVFSQGVKRSTQNTHSNIVPRAVYTTGSSSPKRPDQREKYPRLAAAPANPPTRFSKGDGSALSLACDTGT